MADNRNLYGEFGERVRKHRHRLQLSQEALGARVRLSRTSITNIEQGRQKILLHHLFALAEALETSPETLLPAAKISVPTPQIEKKLPKGLSHKEKEWVHKVVAVSNDGGNR